MLVFSPGRILEMLVFVEGGKPVYPRKQPRSKARTNNKLNPHMTPSRNRTQATLVGVKRSRHCVIHAPYWSDVAIFPLIPGKISFQHIVNLCRFFI